ncbi:MAG: hypothetical protein AB8B70_10890, partial [Prochlorococcus sp.]
ECVDHGSDADCDNSNIMSLWTWLQALGPFSGHDFFSLRSAKRGRQGMIQPGSAQPYIRLSTLEGAGNCFLTQIKV